MKRLILISTLVCLIVSCDKDVFDFNNPDVKSFVEELKAGTYGYNENDEYGQTIWLKMPPFNESHISCLIEMSDETSKIYAFPVNPISSRSPYAHGRDYFVLGECLLWIVEGIRNGTGYGSLDPFLYDVRSNDPYAGSGLSRKEILEVRAFYREWWDEYKDGEWKEQDPLEGKDFAWF